jgi:hypothetical protein
MKLVRQILAYSDHAIGFIQTHFISLNSFMGIPNSVKILYKREGTHYSAVLPTIKFCIKGRVALVIVEMDLNCIFFATVSIVCLYKQKTCHLLGNLPNKDLLLML